VQHTLEGIAGQLPEFLQICTAENSKNGLIGIQEFSRFFRFVDKEASGHITPDFLHNGDALLIQLEFVSEHILIFRLSVMRGACPAACRSLYRNPYYVFYFIRFRQINQPFPAFFGPEKQNRSAHPETGKGRNV
jgi:hypothetical protein